MTTYSGPFNLKPELLWCEVDLPPFDAVAPPPVDEKLDQEANALRNARRGEELMFSWEEISEVARISWRRVALAAREIYQYQWE